MVFFLKFIFHATIKSIVARSKQSANRVHCKYAYYSINRSVKNVNEKYTDANNTYDPSSSCAAAAEIYNKMFRGQKKKNKKRNIFITLSNDDFNRIRLLRYIFGVCIIIIIGVSGKFLLLKRNAFPFLVPFIKFFFFINIPNSLWKYL